MKNQAAQTTQAQQQQAAAQGQQPQGQATQQPIPLRTLSVPEVVAMAISRRRALLAKGKTSRRVPLYLRPSLIPPPSGRYQCSIGEVRIYSRFDQEKGAWFVQITLPETEGFKLGDFVSNNSD